MISMMVMCHVTSVDGMQACGMVLGHAQLPDAAMTAPGMALPRAWYLWRRPPELVSEFGSG